MTTETKCTIYYSLSGEDFDISDLNSEGIEHAPALLRLYNNVEQPDATEISVAYPIKKGAFFNSESICLFLNGKDELLQVGSTNRFRILMMRDAQDYERLHIKFEQPNIEGKPAWLAATKTTI